MVLSDEKIERLEQLGKREGGLAMRYHVLKLAIKNNVFEDDIWQEVQIYRKRKELRQEVGQARQAG